MTTEKFSFEQFENVLPSFAEYVGMQYGEEVWQLEVNQWTKIVIRSSIDKSGYAASTGQDSIRLYIQVFNNGWKPYGKGLKRWITRIKGWEERLYNALAEVYRIAAKISVAPTNCPKCDKVTFVGQVKKQGPNIGRPFQNCKCGFFEWLDTKPAGVMHFDYEDDFEQEEIEPAFEFPTPEIEEQKGFTPSKYQKAIFDFVQNGTGHGIVYGVAGCGKTTTNVEAAKLVPVWLKSVFLAFNRHIAVELQERGVNASTFHALGKAAISSSLQNAKFNQYKDLNIMDNLEEGLSWDYKGNVAKVISLLKGNLLAPTEDNIIALIEDFNIDLEIETGNLEFAGAVFRKSVAQTDVYNFDDMIYFPATGIVKPDKYDFVFVDEAQDLNKAQIQFALNILAENGRMLLIGDPYQSIYAFRGAFVGIMDYMQKKLNATELPLTISYRAPKAIVKLVNHMFPEITFEGSETAIEGKVSKISYNNFLEEITPADGIICRTNAPLVTPCFALIRQGIKATILGSDIGKSLVSLINKRAKLKRVEKAENQLAQLIEELYVYFNLEKPKLEKANKTSLITRLEDQIETIVAISDGCETIEELKEKVKNTFSEDKEGVVFSSVHKAKGLEWNRVFILEPNNMPHKLARTPEALEQERNIQYVAFTRAKEELLLVTGKG